MRVAVGALVLCLAWTAGAATLTGLVRERGTRKPLAFADVAVTGPGVEEAAITDEKGVFTVADLVAGTYRVAVASPGHRRATFTETLSEGETLTVTYPIDPNDVNPYTTTVEGQREGDEVERHSATGAEAARIPGTRGDPFRVVESFPGVARPPFGIGALIVRGSNPEDTTSILDGHELPIIYHFGGVTSIVNPDLLERIDFLPGNFSARYGRATGGVVGADLRDPRSDRWGGTIAVSPIDSSFLLEGPVGDGSLAVAARRSYVDFVLDAVLPDDADIGLTVAPVYWDYQVIWQTPLAGGKLTITAIGSSDRLELLLKKPTAADAAIRGTLEQATFVEKVIAGYRKKLGADTSLYATLAQGVTSITANIGQALTVEVLQIPISHRVEVEHRPWPWLRLSAGVEGVLYPFHVKARGSRPPGEGEVPTPTSLSEQLVQDDDGWELRQGVFAEAAVRVGPVTVTPGVRVDGYRLIDDVSVDPRITAVWEVLGGRAHGGFGRYSKSVEEYESDAVFGNPALKPQHALHASVGYDHPVAPGVLLESTLFGKWLSDQVVRSDNLVARPDGSLAPVGYTNGGEGRVLGLELLVRGMVGPVSGWLSYSLSRAERSEGGGPTRLFSFDQTHALTVLASVRLPWRLTVGGRFRYASGYPVTPIAGSIFDADSDSYTPIGGAINSERLDAYHELDLRFERTWIFDSWKLSGFLDIANVYSRRNPEGYSYSYDYRQRQLLAGLPILPSFGVKGEF